MNMVQLTILTENQALTVSARPGETLGDVLHAHVPAFAMPCAGNHTCGKCRVRVDGPVSPMTETERQLLGRTPEKASAWPASAGRRAT